MGRKYPKYLEKDMEFGRLTVVGVDESSKIDKNGNRVNPSKWKYTCICECGNVVSIRKDALIGSVTNSCGCIQKEKAKKNLSIAHENNTKINETEDCGSYIKVFFFNCEDYTVIDKEDYDKVKDYCWYKESVGYSVARVRGCSSHIKMHQILLQTENGYIPDHKDMDKLNNRKSNLRPVTRSQNQMNKGLQSNNNSGYRGIQWNNNNKNWRAGISVNKKHIELGSFKNKEDAIKARKEAEEKYFGEYSYDNSRKEEK